MYSVMIITGLPWQRMQKQREKQGKEQEKDVKRLER